MKPGEWKTRDGVILRLGDMTREHLRNCIAMLQRQIDTESFGIGLYATLGEFAQDAASDAVGESMFDRYTLEKKRDELQAELDRRPSRAISPGP